VIPVLVLTIINLSNNRQLIAFQRLHFITAFPSSHLSALYNKHCRLSRVITGNSSNVHRCQIQPVSTTWHDSTVQTVLRYLELSKRNDVTVLWSMPGGLLSQCVVVVEPRCLLIKQFPPLITICLLTDHPQTHQLSTCNILYKRFYQC